MPLPVRGARQLLQLGNPCEGARRPILISSLASGARTLALTRLFPGFILGRMDDIFCNNLVCAKK